MKERHPGENTAAEIKSISTEFGIMDENVSAIVTDNAPNMVSVCNTYNGRMSDVLATLQPSTRGAFEHSLTIKRIIASCKRLVKHFRKSVIVSYALPGKQEQMAVKVNRLIIDCETCWNST